MLGLCRGLLWNLILNQRVWSLKPGAAPIDCLGNQPEPTQEERLASKQLRGARESWQGI
jgi:hypothetical protein